MIVIHIPHVKCRMARLECLLDTVSHFPCWNLTIQARTGRAEPNNDLIDTRFADPTEKQNGIETFSRPPGSKYPQFFSPRKKRRLVKLCEFLHRLLRGGIWIRNPVSATGWQRGSSGQGSNSLCFFCVCLRGCKNDKQTESKIMSWYVLIVFLHDVVLECFWWKCVVLNV